MSLLTSFITGPNHVVVLTHIDNICTEVNKDVSKVFHSMKVNEVVERASDLTGVPKYQIFPVKNYEKEQEVDEKLNILLLLALQKIVDFSVDHIEGTQSDDYTNKATVK